MAIPKSDNIDHNFPPLMTEGQHIHASINFCIEI